MEESPETAHKENRKSRIGIRVLKWLAGIVTAILLLVSGAITAVVHYLSPQKLTRIVEEYAPRFINGEVEAGRIELTFWHTFPRLSLDIDSLTLVSNALKKLDASTLENVPRSADTLLTLEKFHGALNLSKLLAGEIEIYDVSLSRPAVNIVIATDSVANYDIVYPSEITESESSMPRFSVESFELLNSGPLTFVSLPDSIDVRLFINRVEAKGHAAPVYSLATDGNLRLPFMNDIISDSLMFELNGSIKWNPEEPLDINFNKFIFGLGGISVTGSAEFELADTITVKAMTIDIPDASVNDMLRFLPDDMQKELKGIDTDMKVSFSATLEKPYLIYSDTTLLPTISVNLKIPGSRFFFPRYNVYYNKVLLAAKAFIDGENLDKSTVEIGNLLIDGRALDLQLNATVKNPLSNAVVAGEVKGRVITNLLPQKLLNSLPAKIEGTIGMDTRFRLKQSYLSPEKFHKIYANGVVSLRDFMIAMPLEETADTMKLYSKLSMFRFKSDETVEVNGVKVDSLLTATLTTDTLSYSDGDIIMQLRNLEASFGSKNVSGSADTTKINPFGVRLGIEALRYHSSLDSIRFGMRRIEGSGSLSRYHDMGKVPDIKFNLTARHMSAGTPDMRVTVIKPEFSLKANVNPPRQRRARMSARSDSTNIHKRIRKQHPAETATPHKTDSIPTDTMSRGLKELISRWNLHGELHASRGRLFTPMFPLNNSFRKIDLHFTTDSIDLKSLYLKAGSSDFGISGTISNLKRTMLNNGRRHSHNPLKIDFAIESDTIDIDQLARAVFAGAAANAQGVRDTTLWTVTDTEENVDVTIETDTTSSGPLLIPSSIDATVRFRADNLIYSGMLLHNFSGEMEVWDSALRLRDLKASSEVGALSLSALYSAPRVGDMEFGMGLKLTDFRIERFARITPAVAELLPAIKDFSGVINADIAATTMLDSAMNFIIPSLEAAIKIDGDSLVLLDADTFKSLSKWLMFKNKKRNLIEHMSVELMIDSSQIVIFPFIFDIDRYKLGVMGSNDLNFNLNYHVSVLKSPLPFKFGINIKGDLDNMKIRLGGAKVKENAVVERLAISSTTRINLLNELEGVFRRGANSERRDRMKLSAGKEALGNLNSELEIETDSLTSAQAEALSETTVAEAEVQN